MSVLEAMQTVQFVTIKNKRFAVVDAAEWEAIIEWLETLEERQIVKDAYQTLDAAQGDRTRAGWLRWEDVRDEVV